MLQGRPEQNAQVGQCAPRAHDDRVHGRRSHREALQRSAQAQVPSLEACGAPRQASDKHLVSVRQACGSWPALRMAAVVRRQRRHAQGSGVRVGAEFKLRASQRHVCVSLSQPGRSQGGLRSLLRTTGPALLEVASVEDSIRNQYGRPACDPPRWGNSSQPQTRRLLATAWTAATSRR